MQPVVSGAHTPHASVWSPARRTKVALALFGFGWVWFGAAFTAREGAWWNALSVGVAIFAVATAVAACGERSRHGYGVLAVSALFLLVLIGLWFG